MIRLALMFLLLAAPAQACRQALALGLDVSGSVDAREYRQQLDGLAAALGAPEVREALLDPAAGPVRLAVFEWSGPGDRAMLVEWTTVRDTATLAQVQSRLRQAQRHAAAPTTGLGSAMLAGVQLLAGQGDCSQETLDISGDGPSNAGPRPQDLGIGALPGEVTINALVVGQSEAVPDLAGYFRAYVIRGPGAFVETAQGYDDYEAAMRRKLLRELRSVAIGLIGPDQ